MFVGMRLEECTHGRTDGIPEWGARGVVTNVISPVVAGENSSSGGGRG